MENKRDPFQYHATGAAADAAYSAHSPSAVDAAGQLTVDSKSVIPSLEEDAGEMYDLLAQIVDAYDNQLRDRLVTRRDGTKAWLIHELAREIVDRHDQRKVKS